MAGIEMMPIGTVKNDVHQAVETNWGKVTSEIHLNPDLTAGLQGLDDWSHVIVLFLIHEGEYLADKHLVSRPAKRDEDRKSVV